MKKQSYLPLCIILSLLISFNTFNITCAAPPGKTSNQLKKTYSQIDNLIYQGKYYQASNYCNEMLKYYPNDSGLINFSGIIYSAQNKLDKAQKEFLKVTDKQPQNAVARNGLGIVYFKKASVPSSETSIDKSQYYVMALNEFEAATKSAPLFYKAYNNAGKVLQHMGKIDEAQEYYQKALDIKPDDSETLDNIGQILFLKGQNDEAIEKFRQSIAFNNKNFSAQLHLGQALIKNGDTKGAIDYLKKTLYTFPSSAPVHDLLGRAYELEGNETEAIREYRKASLIKPDYLPYYLKLADIYVDRGEEEFAISELRSAMAKNTYFDEGKLRIAEISLNMGKTDQAIKSFKDLIQNGSFTKQALQDLVNAYFIKFQEISSNNITKQEYDEAEKRLLQSLEYNPNDIQLHLALLRIYRMTGNASQADIYLGKIFNAKANNPFENIVKGEAYLTYYRYKDAKREFYNAISRSDRVDELLYMSNIFIMNRSYQPAKDALSRVLVLDENNPVAKRLLEKIQKNEDQAIAKLNVAKSFLEADQRKDAIEAFKDCISLNPDLPEAQLLMAKAYEKEKQYSKAVQHYEAYVNLVNTKDKRKYRKKIQKLNNKLKK